MRRNPCHSSLSRRHRHVTFTTLARQRAQAARAVCVRRAASTAAQPAPTTLPTATSFLTIICVLLVFYHYYSLVLFYVLSSASRSHRHRPPCTLSAAQIIGRAITHRQVTDYMRHLAVRGDTYVTIKLLVKNSSLRCKNNHEYLTELYSRPRTKPTRNQ